MGMMGCGVQNSSNLASCGETRAYTKHHVGNHAVREEIRNCALHCTAMIITVSDIFVAYLLFSLLFTFTLLCAGFYIISSCLQAQIVDVVRAYKICSRKYFFTLFFPLSYFPKNSIPSLPTKWCPCRQAPLACLRTLQCPALPIAGLKGEVVVNNWEATSSNFVNPVLQRKTVLPRATQPRR